MGWVGDQVGFVDGDDEGASGQGGDGGFVFWVEGGGGIEDEEDDVGFGHDFTGLSDADGFGFVGWGGGGRRCR